MGRGDLLEAAPGGLGQHQGEQHPGHGHPGGEQQRAAQAQVDCSTGNRKTPMKAPSLPMPAEIPWPVARMDTGYSSLGMTNVVMFGPNSVKK